MRLNLFHEREVALGIHRDEVALLYDNLGSVVFLGTIQVVACALAAARLADVILVELVFLGAFALAARAGVILAYRYTCPADADRNTVNGWETRYLVASAASAAVLGAGGMRIFLSQDPTAESLWSMAMLSLLLDAVARVSGRYWTSLYALGFATLPPVVALLTWSDPVHLAYAGFLCVNVAVGVQIIVANARVRSQLIRDARSFASQANEDPLTRLPNRVALNRFLEQSLATQEAERLTAVHCLDLDLFKQANDHYGHPVGDALLESFATRVRMSLRLGDMLARVGGDEFVIVQCGLRGEIEAALLAQRVIDLMAEPFDIREQRISLGVSIGIALATTAAANPFDLLAQADEALYRTKRRNRNGFCFAGQEPSYRSTEPALASVA